MEVEPRTRRSKDILVDFRTFATEFDRTRPEMKKIIRELQKICERTRQRKKEVPIKALEAAVAAGAVVLTGGASLLVSGALGAAAAGGVVVLDKITDKGTLDDVKKLVNGLCDLVQPLKDIQERRREMLQELDIDLQKLDDIVKRLSSLLNIFLIFTSDSTVENLKKVTKQCEEVLKELDWFRENISDVVRGSSVN